MAKKLVRVLRPQPPDAYYLKKVSHHTRELLNVGAAPKATRLPELLTDAELMAFYEAVWGARQLTHVVMLKLLLFTGTRNAELVHLRPPMSICRPAGCGLSRAKAVRIAMSSSP
jgi:integrase/recombinase XerD